MNDGGVFAGSSHNWNEGLEELERLRLRAKQEKLFQQQREAEKKRAAEAVDGRTPNVDGQQRAEAQKDRTYRAYGANRGDGVEGRPHEDAQHGAGCCSVAPTQPKIESVAQADRNVCPADQIGRNVCPTDQIGKSVCPTDHRQINQDRDGLAARPTNAEQKETTVCPIHSRADAQQHGAGYCSVAPTTNQEVGAQQPAKGLLNWREISGITIQNERTMTPKERRAAIRKLKDVVEREIRAELKAAKEDAEGAGERSYLWDPCAAIAHRLGIGPTVLSRLMREFSGMSTSQMVDKIRAEGIREKLREHVKRVIMSGPKPGQDGQRVYGKLSEQCQHFRERLRRSRQTVDFSLATWAIELGFANYTRFYRACLLQYGRTPTQLEEEAVREFAEWYLLAGDLQMRATAERKSWDRSYERYRPPYDDGWAKALRERPGYVARMRGEIELHESVVGMAE